MYMRLARDCDEQKSSATVETYLTISESTGSPSTTVLDSRLFPARIWAASQRVVYTPPA